MQIQGRFHFSESAVSCNVPISLEKYGSTLLSHVSQSYVITTARTFVALTYTCVIEIRIHSIQVIATISMNCVGLWIKAQLKLHFCLTVESDYRPIQFTQFLQVYFHKMPCIKFHDVPNFNSTSNAGCVSEMSSFLTEPMIAHSFGKFPLIRLKLKF